MAAQAAVGAAGGRPGRLGDHPTGSLPSTVKLAQLVQEKGIRFELNCGFDVSHDWEMVAAATRHQFHALLSRLPRPRGSRVRTFI